MQYQYLISIVVYMAAVILIGLIFAKKANKDSESYFLGGRTLGPWVSAMSAEASDMSGWLLMGMPGLAYLSGYANAGWTAIGIALGTYLNWLIVSKRLRRYSERLGAITIPEFFSSRFGNKNSALLVVSSILIIVFFTPYAGSCLMACGKLFAQLFNADYRLMVIISAAFVLTYTFLGGFLAESASDFMQGVVMIITLVAVLVTGVIHGGGVSEVIARAKEIPGLLSLFTQANPTGEVINGVVQFGEPVPMSFITIASGLVWGLGYFGMPQVLLRFMAIRNEKELKLSRRVATIWVVISLLAAITIGVIGRVTMPDAYLDTLSNNSGASENIFILMATSWLPALLAGLICAGILAAAISSSDSYLLISASAVAKNIFHGIIKKNATEKQILFVTRIVLMVIMIIAAIVAMTGNTVILSLVDFAWAGLGATFGPLMLFSLFWKRTTHEGAIAGMLSGGITAIVWNFLEGGIFDLYEIGPAFVVSAVCIVVVSLLSGKPDEKVIADFEAVAK